MGKTKSFWQLAACTYCDLHAKVQPVNKVRIE